MITDLSYDAFCRKYIDFAQKSAKIAIASYIENYGEQDASIDLDLVKDISISKALEKAYKTYDPENESKASIKTYLNTILRNQIYTEIGKEVTATGVNMKFSLDESYNEGGKALSEDEDSLSGNYDFTGAQTGSFNQEEDDEKREKKNKLSSYIERLNPEDRIIIECFLLSGNSYTDHALERLGWDESRRELVQKRKERAVNALRSMNEEESHEEEQINESAQEEEPIKEEPKQIYAYSLRLEEMKPYVEKMKDYFGLNHPNLDMELLLLEDDPEREFKLTAYVTYDEIRDAFIKASFNQVGDVEEYVSLLWTVANLYYGDLFQRYEEYEMEEEEDYLRWKCIEEDIVQLYRFMANHKTEEPVTVKIGSDSIELKDYFRWFQALMDYHLFPNCIPDVTSVEQADKFLKKDQGRKIENKVASAIINGVANLFKDEGLVTARAPKNLCQFLQRLLTLMDLKDSGGREYKEDVIKSTINNIQRQKGDPKIFTPEIREVSIEELKIIPFNEARERWLFNPE